jgi:hypothetical protein
VRAVGSCGALAAVALVALPVVWMAEHGCAPERQLDGGKTMTTTPAPAPRDMSSAEVKNRVTMITGARSATFVPVPAGAKLSTLAELVDGERVELDSRQWAETFFVELASPWRPFSRRDRSFLAAGVGGPVDVLLHEYQVGQRALRVYETAESVFVSLEDLVLGPLPEERRQQVADVTAALFKMEGTRSGRAGRTPYKWAFQLDGNDLVEGTTFSSAPEVSVSFMESWANRVGGGIKAGRLYFLLWKRRESGDGRWIRLNEAHWFDGACWTSLQRGKYAPPP